MSRQDSLEVENREQVVAIRGLKMEKKFTAAEIHDQSEIIQSQQTQITALETEVLTAIHL